MSFTTPADGVPYTDAEADDIAVASGVFHGAVTFPTPLSWSAGFGPSVGLQFAQFPLNRLGDDVLDTLDDDLAVLSVFVTET